MDSIRLRLDWNDRGACGFTHVLFVYTSAEPKRLVS